MKYIANHSKKLKVKLVIDLLNNAKIFKQKIPYLKLHNRVPDKKYNSKDNIKVWLTLKDIEEHSKNPKKVCDRLKFDEEHQKIYHQKTSEYQKEIDFSDNVVLGNNDLDTTKKIKQYIKEKINSICSKEWKYELESDSDEMLGNNCMYLKITKYTTESFTVYYGIPTFFYINIVKDKNRKNYLKIELNNRLVFNLFIFV